MLILPGASLIKNAIAHYDITFTSKVMSLILAAYAVQSLFDELKDLLVDLK